MDGPLEVYPDLDGALELVAVQSEGTSLYQLQFAEAPGRYLGLGTDPSVGDDFTSKLAWAYLFPLADDYCGPASTAPGPAAGYVDCESYVFGLKGDLESLHDHTANVTMQWYNPAPNDASPHEYNWVMNGGNYLAGASDPASAMFDGEPGKTVYFRYPIPVPD